MPTPSAVRVTAWARGKKFAEVLGGSRAWDPLPGATTEPLTLARAGSDCFGVSSAAHPGRLAVEGALSRRALGGGRSA